MPISSHSGPAGQEADGGEQQDGQRSDGVAGKHAVKDGRPLERAEHGQHQSDEDGEDRGSEHHVLPSNLVTRASIPPASRSSAPSRTSACTVRTLPLTAVVMVPGVSVIELA